MGSFVKLFPFVCSKCHKRLGQTHARRVVNKKIASEEGKMLAKDWSHLLQKNGCPKSGVQSCFYLYFFIVVQQKIYISIQENDELCVMMTINF